MSDKPDYYDFGGIRLFTAETYLEIPETGKEHTPSKNHRNFLLVLARNAPRMVTYEELWKEVWRSKYPMSDTDLRNIQTTKGQLVLWFKDKTGKDLPVEAVAGTGYRLDCEVIPAWNEIDPEIQSPGEQNKSGRQRNDNNSGLENNFEPLIYPLRPEAVTLSESSRRETEYFDSGSKFPLKWRLLSGISVLTVISVLVWQNFASPRLEKAEFVTTPVPGKEFYLRLTGENFDSETIRLRVVGPACGGDDPGMVKNGELRLYGRITETTIERVPVTLGSGEYRIWLENKNGNSSKELIITVPLNASK